MKPLILALTLVVLTASNAAAEPLPVRLKDGATWRQTIVHQRVDERDGKVQDVTVTSAMQVTYHQRPGQPATLEQDFVSMTSEQLPPEALAQAIAMAKPMFPAVVEVDEALTPTRVLNWSELRDKATALTPSASSDPHAAEAVRAMFAKIDDRTAASLFKEQAMISLGQGTDLKPGQIIPYNGEAPNLLGGPPIKTQGAFRLVSFDKARRRATLTWTQALDPASATASVKATVDALIARAAPTEVEAAKSQLSGFSITREDSCRYEVDTATGLALTADCTNAITSGAGGQTAKRTDRWTITQSLPEAR